MPHAPRLRSRAAWSRLKAARGQAALTRQTWTAIVSAVLFVGCALGIAAIPIPFVAWAPGTTQDVLGAQGGAPIIKVEGATTYPTNGRLSLTTVSVTRVDARLTLPEAVFDYWAPNRDVLPRDAIYPPGKSAGEVNAEERQLMDTSQEMAVVAALREAGVPLKRMPVVVEVTTSGPANGLLLPGDLIEKVDDTAVVRAGDITKLVRKHKVGDKVVFVVLRERHHETVTIETTKSNDAAAQPVVGIKTSDGFSYKPRITYAVDSAIGGPSAGLVFALAIYDKLSPVDVLAGRSVAGTGTVDYSGTVGPIGGIQQKIAGAEKANATVFLVPAANCADVAGLRTSMKLVRVASVHEAVATLAELRDPATAKKVHTCP